MNDLNKTSGRFGNHFIRNVIISSLSTRHDVLMKYSYEAEIAALGIKLFNGSRLYPMILNLTDENIEKYLQSTPPFQLCVSYNTYFQSNKCSHYLFNYLRTHDIMTNIVKNNKFTERYKANNDVFLHIRLGDVIKNNPGFKYYDKVLSSLTFHKGYIASDTPNHEICMKLKEKYANIEILSSNEVDTILFGSTCKHVVLSHGSFSAIIGYMAFFSNVYYPMYESNKNWYGDMFTNIPGWIRVEH